MNHQFRSQGSEDSGAFNSSTQEVLAVSELIRMVARIFEQQFPLLRVRGEISNLSLASSGHLYFSLKDQHSQIRCVMFRMKAQLSGLKPKDGDLVEVLAQLSIYEPRGDMQLQIEQMRAAGQGDLQLQYLRLKQKLQSEGLFDQERKRPLPAVPRAIGVITSLKAAALRDVLATLAQRMPSIPVVVYPASVQGVAAPGELMEALGLANARGDCDVLLLVRGGGSIEDLWAFNDEALARCIAASNLPVVAGIGHESDVTIADFAADWRAPTPTAAATQSCPSAATLFKQLDHGLHNLHMHWQFLTRRLEQKIDHLARELKSPSQRVQDRAQALHAYTLRLHPPALDRLSQRLDMQAHSLRQIMEHAFESRQQNLAFFAKQFSLLSPQRVLERGYAMALDGSGRVVSEAAQVSTGEALRLIFSRGSIQVQVQAQIDAAEPGF